MTGAQVIIFGLLIKCPFNQEKHDCPLASQRATTSLEEKFDCARMIDKETIGQIIQFHTQCFENRFKGEC